MKGLGNRILLYIYFSSSKFENCIRLDHGNRCDINIFILPSLEAGISTTDFSLEHFAFMIFFLLQKIVKETKFESVTISLH